MSCEFAIHDVSPRTAQSPIFPCWSDCRVFIRRQYDIETYLSPNIRGTHFECQHGGSFWVRMNGLCWLRVGVCICQCVPIISFVRFVWNWCRHWRVWIDASVDWISIRLLRGNIHCSTIRVAVGGIWRPFVHRGRSNVIVRCRAAGAVIVCNRIANLQWTANIVCSVIDLLTASWQGELRLNVNVDWWLKHFFTCSKSAGGMKVEKI